MNGFKQFFLTFLGALAGVVASIFIFIMFIVGLVTLATQKNQEDVALKGLKKGTVIVLNLSEEVSEISRESFLGMPTENNLHDIRETIEEASEDERVQGVLLKMGPMTPMGWATAKELRKILEEFKESKKSIVAYGEMVDEKALYISSVAQKIYMHPTGEVSWNGFAAVPMFYKGLFEKLEIEPIIFKAGKFKSAVEPFTQKKMSAESKQQTEELLEDLWEETLDVVSSSRGIDINELREFAENFSVRTAEQANKIGLVNGLSRYSDLLEMFLKGEDKEKKITKEDFKKFVSVQGYKHFRKNRNLFSSLDVDSLFTQRPKSKSKIAVLVLEGSIMPGKSEEGVIGSSSVVHEIQKLRLDDDIKGLVVRVNSPGGSALASDVIWYELEKFKEEKPFYVSMGDVAASGGYYISAGANKIFAEANTITGSIGAFSILFNVQKTMNEKAGLTFDRVVTSKYADIASGVRSMKDDEKEIFQGELERIYKTFLRVVGKGRKFENFDSVESVAQGRVWSGLQAKEAGLVDELGGLDDCVTSLSEELALEDYDLDFYPKSKGFEGFLEKVANTGVRIQEVENLVKNPMQSAQKLSEKLQSERALLLAPYYLKIN